MYLLPISLPAAFLTAAIILLHTFWGVVFFDACERRRYWALGLVVGSHLLTSGLVSWRQGLKLGRKAFNGEWDVGERVSSLLNVFNLPGRRRKGESFEVSHLSIGSSTCSGEEVERISQTVMQRA